MGRDVTLEEDHLGHLNAGDPKQRLSLNDMSASRNFIRNLPLLQVAK